ncbi:class A beta-lactamase, subclass A2 [Puniceicoccaceae bacterium K14]|nr:class A beta-lactamase, subclass A2 [Puniceicoccaceae bacterium K14]
MQNLSFLHFLLLTFSLVPQGLSVDTLRNDVIHLLEEKNATVGVAIWGPDLGDIVSVNGDSKLPMQSVFKLHLAVTVLAFIDEGKFGLDDKMEITKAHLDNNLWSPIRKKFPDGVTLSLGEILKYTVAQSDNVGCDVLFDLIGGPSVVEEYIHDSGIDDCSIVHNETTMQKVWKRQYDNWTTANAANLVLKTFFENKKKALSEESHRFLWETMKDTKTGKDLIKRFLPKGTIVAHKTGYSGINDDGITGARNNIGIVFLPNGDHFYLSILVSDSSEENEANKRIIADISKLAWDYFSNK